MNKIIKRFLCFLILFVLTLSSVRLDANAAGGLSISASASQVSSGGTFTVTVKAASNYVVSNISMTVNGGTVVSKLSKTSLDKGETASAKIKLTGEKCVVSVKGVGANYDTETEGNASASVTVKKKTVVVDNRSKDNNLSAITVSEGALSPAFHADTAEYSVNVAGTTSKITLGATANHAKASVSGTGEKAVVPGNNRFVITCTAENGSKKEYVVNVFVDETPTVYSTYGEQRLGVVRNQTDIGIPETFEATTLTIDGQEVPAYHSNQFNLTLIYMISESGEKNFYMYEKEKGITSVFRPVSILGRNVILFDLTEEEQVRKNMVYSEVTIDGITLHGWKYENPDFANYAHILVMNQFGEKVVYQYEKTENSLQLYKEYVPVEEEVEEEKDVFSIGKFTFEKFTLEEYSLYIIIGLAGLCVALILFIIIMALTRKQRCSARKRRYQKKLEKLERKNQKKQEE